MIDPITMNPIPRSRAVWLPDVSREGGRMWDSQGLSAMIHRGNTRHPLTRERLPADILAEIHRKADDIDIAFRLPGPHPAVVNLVVPRSTSAASVLHSFMRRVQVDPGAGDVVFRVNGRMLTGDLRRRVSSLFGSGRRTGVVDVGFAGLDRTTTRRQPRRPSTSRRPVARGLGSAFDAVA